MPLGPNCRPPRVWSKMPRGSEIDTNWVNVVPPLQVSKVLNRPGMWAAGYEWFQFDIHPGKTLTFSELVDLAEAESIPDSAKVARVRLIYPVRARTFEEAAATARRRASKGIPAHVQQEFEKFWETKAPGE